MKKFYSNGKLLISGEYLVLDGANSLTLPTKYGQSLSVKNTLLNSILWKSYSVDKECWFNAEFNLIDFKIKNASLLNKEMFKVATTLQDILTTAKKLNVNFLKDSKGVEVCTELTFPNKWGLGTSSTLINNIAAWAKINAFELLENSFGGSGYDIACAQHNVPITYQRKGIHPQIKEVTFNPSFKEQLFFVYLNQKQDSKEGIKMYRSLTLDKESLIDEVNDLTQRIIKSKTLFEFELLLSKHETALSAVLEIPTVQQKLFKDFKGVVKSLGAWGGDFVLVTGNLKYVNTYFKNKGYTTIIAYNDMILN